MFEHIQQSLVQITSVRTAHMCVLIRLTVQLCTIAVHNTALNNSDNIPSYFKQSSQLR